MKTLLLFLIFFTSLYGEAKIYMGASAGLLNENYTDNEKFVMKDADKTGSSPMAKFKLGYGDRDAYAIEFSLDYAENAMQVFSKDDDKKYGINVELIKAFNFDTYINPFFKAGFGSGFLDTKSEYGTINYGSFNLGAGFFVPIGEHFDLELGYDYKYISYERIEVKDSAGIVTEDFILESHINVIYAGFNVRF